MRVFVRGKRYTQLFSSIKVYVLISTSAAIFGCAPHATNSNEVYNPSGISLIDVASMGRLQDGNLPVVLPLQCRLWSDWSQLCSYLGEKKWFCIDSEIQSEESSAPFCLDAAYGISPQTQYLSKQSFESSRRFCDRSYEVTQEIYKGEASELVVESTRYCDLYGADRPFNGKRIAERRHPWCTEWSDSATREMVCSETSTGIQSCQKLASEKFQSANRLVCSNWRLPNWCEEAHDYYEPTEGPNEKAQLKMLGEIIERFGPGPRIPPPVYGVECVWPGKSTEETNK